MPCAVPGPAEGGLKLFATDCDDPSGARGFGRIATSFLKDKDRRRQRGWDIRETLTREQ